MKDRLQPSNKLRAYWSRKEEDVMFYHPKRKPDSNLLYHFLSYIKDDFGGGEMSLCDELDRRGFDLTTLRFSIAYKEK